MQSISEHAQKPKVSDELAAAPLKKHKKDLNKPAHISDL
jgi:hypothetical protein